MAVSCQIVELIDIDVVTLVGDDLVEKVLLAATFPCELPSTSRVSKD
jgi:hypothetical protein